MSHLIAVIFDNPDEAAQVRETLGKAQKGDYISLEDSAVVVRDAGGKLHIKNEVDRGVKVGALWGSVIGVLLSSFLFPLFGIAMGALGGLEGRERTGIVDGSHSGLLCRLGW